MPNGEHREGRVAYVMTAARAGVGWLSKFWGFVALVAGVISAAGALAIPLAWHGPTWLSVLILGAVVGLVMVEGGFRQWRKENVATYEAVQRAESAESKLAKVNSFPSSGLAVPTAGAHIHGVDGLHMSGGNYTAAGLLVSGGDNALIENLNFTGRPSVSVAPPPEVGVVLPLTTENVASLVAGEPLFFQARGPETIANVYLGPPGAPLPGNGPGNGFPQSA